jgi:YhcH/YjgK/YiaL family protein
MNMITKAIFFRLATVIFIILIFAACSEKKETNLQKKRDHIILNKLDQAEKYFDMHPEFKKVFTFLREKNIAELALGRHEIDKNRLFYIIQRELGRNRSESKLEAHRKYIDIQYVIAGSDEMGWKPTSDCEMVAVPYDEDNDIMFFSDEPKSWNQVPAGSFTIFFPQDAHAPMVSKSEIHKIVFKVAVE